MKNFLFCFPFIMLFVVCISNANSQDWSLLTNSPSNINGHKDLWFLNANTGWLASGNSGIYKTTNGGNNWLNVYSGADDIRAVVFADSLNGWATSLRFDNGPCLYKSTNGGLTWQSITNIPSPGVLGLMGLSVYNKDIINASGQYLNTPRFVRTTNGGANWICKDLSAYAYAVVDCHFTSRDTGFIIGHTRESLSFDNRGVILGTENGGETWSVKYTTSLRVNYGWKLSFPTSNAGYGSFQNVTNGSPSIFVKTTNGGVTWTQIVYTPAPNYFYDIQGIGFLTPNIGWVGRVNSNYIFETTNGGDNWHQVSFGTNINRFRFVNDSIGYAAGDRVYKFARTFLLSAEPSPGLNPENFSLSQNYPNPFNPSTIIRYSIPKTSLVKMNVYDISGKLIKTLIHETKAPGNYEVKFNGEILSSGVYFYKLDAGSFTDIKKLILIK